MNETLKLEDTGDGMMRERAIGNNRDKQQTRDVLQFQSSFSSCVYNKCSAYTSRSKFDTI